MELQNDYKALRAKAKSGFDFYNIIEKSVLEMEEDSKQTHKVDI